MPKDQSPVIVLAGGKSTRLGRDKASETLAGRPMLQHVLDACREVASRYVIVCAGGQRLPEIEAPAAVDVIEDEFDQAGPLGGIYTGLNHLQEHQIWGDREAALVVACDMPLLQPTLLVALQADTGEHDAVVPVRDGLPEPLCAFYTAACIAPARNLLERRAFKVSGLLDVVDAHLEPEAEWRAHDQQGLSFLNVNREEDLRTVSAILAR